LQAGTESKNQRIWTGSLLSTRTPVMFGASLKNMLPHIEAQTTADKCQMQAQDWNDVR